MQQQYTKLLPLLINKDDFDQDQDKCGLCQDLITKPVICDNCQSSICQDCSLKNQDHTKKVSVCPLCNSKCDFNIVQPKGFILRCPFSQQCKQQITPQTFVYHVMSSQHVDQDTKAFYKEKLGNKCLKGHQLKLFKGTFKSLTGQQCNECGKIGLGRNQCEQCNVIFCVNCRPIYVKNQHCQQGHKFSRVVPKQNLPFLCDICDKKQKDLKEYFVDKPCNIGICPTCWQRFI